MIASVHNPVNPVNPVKMPTPHNNFTSRTGELKPRELMERAADPAPAFARDVFKEALKWGSHAVMVAHNHPAGDPTPSESDLAFTRQLIELGQLAGIPVLDHLVLGAADGDRPFVSIREFSSLEF